MTADVTLTNVANSAASTQQQGIKLAEDFDDFLILLTTQLQNQDPLNPMDSTEFTNQIVQFTQVEQAINMNQKLDNLVSLQLSTIASTGLQYVGMNISYVSAEMDFDGTTPIDITYALGEQASSAKINIYDEAGELVYTGDASKAVGQNKFKWNGEHMGGGTAEEGTYTVEIAAFDGAGDPIDVTTVVSGMVRGIETQNGVIYLLVGDRAVPVGNVLNASLPETPADDTGGDDSGGEEEPPPEDTEDV